MDGTATRTATPVLLLAFNRPEPTRRVLERIADAGVGRLYVAIDGPRPGRPGEAERCEQVAALVDERRWADEIHVRRRDANLGCKDGVTNGLDWFFGHEPEGIVLEDDCLPGTDFFGFCDQMLASYRADDRVWLVSGDNLLQSWRPRRSDWFFGDGGIWGWASWADCWRRRDIAMTSWHDPAARERARAFLGPFGWRHLAPRYAEVATGSVDTWDYQWSWTRASHGGLSVIPARNLVTNIGFGSGATHTSEGSRFSDLPTGRLGDRLRPPPAVAFDRGYQHRLLLEETAGRLMARARRAIQWRPRGGES
ncbi:MAG TPA: hypothetical protein VM282_17885 [Acidimicrobiales bacterium]|nr:hypothetical protein [Acidimicrobiales bacterium]